MLIRSTSLLLVFTRMTFNLFTSYLTFMHIANSCTNITATDWIKLFFHDCDPYAQSVSKSGMYLKTLTDPDPLCPSAPEL